MTELKPLPLPSGICTACIHEAHPKEHPAGRLALYCPHHRAGAVLQPASDGEAIWTIWTPVTQEEFAASLARYSERLLANVGAQGGTLQ